VKDIQNSKVEPIQPVFVDFKKDITLTETKKKLPVIYKQNKDNDLFTLVFRYEFGHQDDNRYSVATDYLDYVGTDQLSAADIKQQFYQLACNYSIHSNADCVNVTLSGLSENMQPALQLLEKVLHHAKADKTSYDQFIDLTLKARDDRKKDQRTCFDYLYHYGVYGSHNIRRDDMTEKQLRETDPQQLLDLLKNLSTLEHRVLYYGPLSEKALSDMITKEHQTPKALLPVPKGKPFTAEQTPKDEIWIAPYDAKNIYMRMFHNEGRAFRLDEAATITIFNEYYGGGMNGIVFQEMREARGLAYNASARYFRPERKGQSEFFFTHIITQNDKMMDCVNHFHCILDTIPQSEAAFQIAKEAVIKQMASQRTTKFNTISRYLTMQKLGYDYDINEKIFRDLKDVTLQDIVRFEQQQIARKPYRYLLLGDEKELDMKSLERIAPVKRLTLEEIFGY
jgi:predicted Zn-dependent peptidase